MPYRVYVLGCLLAVVVVVGLLIRDGRAAVVASSGLVFNGATETPLLLPLPPPPTAPPTEPAPGPTPMGNAYAPFVVDTALTPEVGPTETPEGSPPPPTIPPPYPTEEPLWTPASCVDVAQQAVLRVDDSTTGLILSPLHFIPFLKHYFAKLTTLTIFT